MGSQGMGSPAGVKQIRVPVDKSCGLDCKGTPPLKGSPDVFADQLKVVRVSDKYIPHCGHIRVASQGSDTVFANQLAHHGAGHKISCGDKACKGSSTVYIG